MTLPPGWAKARFADIASQKSGNGKLIKGKLQAEPGEGLYPAFSASGQDVWRDAYEYEGDAIVVSAVGARCGKAFRASGQWSAIANTHVVRSEAEIDTDFLFLILNDEQFWEKGGTAQPFVKVTATFERTMALPPAAEQRRIVAKLVALTARLTRARTELDRVPALAKKLVRSALTAAFSQTEACERVPLKTVASKIGSGSTPRGGKDVYLTDGVPFIRSQNVYFEGFDYDGLVGISDEAARALSGVTVRARDVLLNITGASIGRGCIVPDDLIGARVNQHVAIIRPTPELEPDYLLAFLRTPAIQDWIWNENYGVTRQALTKGMIEGLEVPLPSSDQQKEICSFLNAAFARADRLQAEAARARALLDRLEASILARAFRGELVPQDPNDEPASMLLERIRAQRGGDASPRRRRRVGVAVHA